MKIEVHPQDDTCITIVPSEDNGYICAMLIKNDFVDATLRMTSDDVEQLIGELSQYRQGVA